MRASLLRCHTAALSLALALLGAADAARAETRRSGFDFMTPAVQAMQRDDTLNPAWLWLKDGEQAFARQCLACHSSASLRGAAASYPAFDAVLGKPVNLSQRINLCRQRHLKAPPWDWESGELLALETYVGHAARGLPISPPVDARLSPWREQGRQLYAQRIGQLDLSCAQCHEGNAGRRLAGSTITQAHPSGYPIYRLEWQGVGSLQRRLRSCMSGVRAEPYAFGADELVALELYLKQRAAGMLIETPAVRP